MKIDDLGAPMDVLWFRLTRHEKDSGESMGRFEAGRIFVLIDRGDYWQCAYVIAKGTIDELRAKGLDVFRAGIAQSVPMFADRVGDLKDWDQIKLLTVAVDRMPVWHRPGLLCIGDAAHAMSPIGGVGVNLAVQDAVAAANILCEPLRRGSVSEPDLARVQARREFPAKVTQAVQVFLQNKVISRALAASGELRAPLPVRLMARWPLLRRIPARLLGLGVRPEHVRTAVA
jgi:2-polyprenyl-6-methoxyphenol hydroxylase-like FAD-dependent oxidoreductase